jgi:hypothetical protein
LSTARNEGAGARGWLRLLRREKPARRRKGYASEQSSDVIIAGLGIALGLVCAFFPWYVFFNQDKFGIRAVQFSGDGSTDIVPDNLTYQPSLVGQRISVQDVPLLELDGIATGTVPDEADPAASEVPLSQQPFPGDDGEPPPEYRVVHIANGRAMIEDKEGLYVVQTGSILPDKSRVASIEQRDGGWVIITNSDQVVPLDR